MRWLITGASGLLGHSLISKLGKKNHDLTGIINSHSVNAREWCELKFDITKIKDISALVDKIKPDVIVHAAGLTDVDACETNEDIAQKIHSDAAEYFAKACLSNKIKFVLISTDHLWDGTKSLMCEDDPLMPINAYARTKADGERRVEKINPEALIIRTNFYGKGLPWRKSISDWMVEKLLAKEKINGFTDSYFTPICLEHLTDTITKLVDLEAQGTYHVGGAERISKYNFAQELCKKLSLPDYFVVPTRVDDANLVAQRPKDLSLNTDKLANLLKYPLPNVKEGVETLGLTAHIQHKIS